MDPTGTGEARDVEAIAPAVRLVRPFGRATTVPEHLARVDRDAVHDAGRQRLQLAADRRRGGLVEHGETLVHIALADEQRSVEGESERGQIAVAEATREVLRPLQLRQRGIEVAGLPDVQRPGQLEVAVRQLVPAAEEAIGPGEPALRDGQPASREVVHRELERNQARGYLVARLGTAGVRALADVHGLLQVPGPP